MMAKLIEDGYLKPCNVWRKRDVALSGLSLLSFLAALYSMSAFCVAKVCSTGNAFGFLSQTVVASFLGELSLLLCSPHREGRRLALGSVEVLSGVVQVVVFSILPNCYRWLIPVLASVFLLTRFSSLTMCLKWIWRRSMPQEIPGTGLSVCLTLLISTMLLIAHPLMICAKDMVGMGDVWFPILCYGTLVSVGLALICAIVAHKSARNPAGYCLTLSLLFLSCVMLMYLFLVPSDFGTLQGAELIGGRNPIVKRFVVYEAELLLLLACLFFAWMLLRFVPSVILSSVTASLTVAFVLMGVSQCMIGAANARPSYKTGEVPRIVLSSNSQNTLVFVLDMVQGASFSHVANDPQLASKLNGFVWYPNSVAISPYTLSSIPSIFGGAEGDPLSLNRDNGHDNRRKVTNLICSFRDQTKRRGLDFQYFGGDYRHAKSWYDGALTYDPKDLCKLLGRESSHDGYDFKLVLWDNALLRSVPFSLKPLIYNKGQWFGMDGTAHCPFSRDHMFLQALPQLSEIRDGMGAVQFFDIQATHNPWGVPGADGRYSQADSVQILKWTLGRICDYLDWMRRNGVYDNTRIILISDHGLTNVSDDDVSVRYDPMQHKERWSELVEGCHDDWLIDPLHIQAFNNLLVVKDFKHNDALGQNDRLVSSSDVPAIVSCENVSRLVEQLPTSRNAYLIPLPKVERNEFAILACFCIEKNVFDLRNWRRVGP